MTHEDRVRLATDIMEWSADDKPKRVYPDFEDGPQYSCSWAWLDKREKKTVYLDSWKPDILIEQALMVAEKIGSPWFCVSCNGNKSYTCRIQKGRVHPYGTGETMALAICRAALAWLNS